ncbi:MAG: hypothetical protein AB7S65_12000 [Sulfuricurvum sp.]
MHSIPLIRSLPGAEAIRLANELYKMYDESGNPRLRIRHSLLCRFFGQYGKERCGEKIRSVFAELNEPCALRNFEYKGELIQWRVIHFCDILTESIDENDFIDIQLNELFIEALKAEPAETLLNFSNF